MNLIDTHCHYNHADLHRDLPNVIARAADRGVSRAIVVGFDMPSSRLAVQVADQHPTCFAVVGVHPHDAAAFEEANVEELTAMCAHEKVVAIGEIGLDFYRDLSPRPAQFSVFRRQLALAAELGLPIVLHCRDAYNDLLQLLETEMPAGLTGVLHCFSGDAAQAERALALGLYLGFDGPVTYKNAESLREIVRSVPLDRLLVETDAPYLTPHPYRGKPNEPAYLPLVAAKIAELKGLSSEEFASISVLNAERLFPRLLAGLNASKNSEN